MIRTELFLRFHYDGLAEVEWFRCLFALAGAVEQRVQPDPKKEVITWVITPTLALNVAHVCLGGTIELCMTGRLPRVVHASLGAEATTGLQLISKKPVYVELEIAPPDIMQFKRPTAFSLAEAVRQISSQLRA